MSKHHGRERRAGIRQIREQLRNQPAHERSLSFTEAAQAEQVAKSTLKLAHAVYASAPHDPKTQMAYRQALDAWHSALRAVYADEFERAHNLVRGGDAAGLPVAVAFLEQDPFCFGSGYRKADLIRCICRMQLSPEDVDRLRRVVLSVVDRRYGQEFRAYCRLARKVDSPEFRKTLSARLASDDSSVRRRAQWVLDACEKPG